MQQKVQVPIRTTESRRCLPRSINPPGAKFLFFHSNLFLRAIWPAAKYIARVYKHFYIADNVFIWCLPRYMELDKVIRLTHGYTQNYMCARTTVI